MDNISQFILFYIIMTDQKDIKHFQRQRHRYNPLLKRGQHGKEEEDISSEQSSELKQEVQEEEHLAMTVHTIAEKVTWNFSKQGQDSLRKLIATSPEDFTQLLKNKGFRQELRREEKRLTKIRTDQKLTEETDTELSYQAINNILSFSEDIITGLIKEMEAKEAKPVKSLIRANQEKEMTKLLSNIDQQLAENNYSGVKNHIQNLLKRFGKDEFIESKVTYLTSIQGIIDLYQKESNAVMDISKYLQRLSSFDNSGPQTLIQSNIALKNMKKQISLALNKENKKTDSNQQTISYLTSFENITNVVLGYSEPKLEKRGIRSESTSNLELKGVTQTSDYEEAVKYCRQILQKNGQDKQALLKELEMLRRNKKKSGESPYTLIIRLLDVISAQKKEVLDLNAYVKGLSQIFIKKMLTSEAVVAETVKLDEKYSLNDSLLQVKQNLQSLIANVQEKERGSKDTAGLEQDIKKLKTQNERLSKTIADQKSKIIEKVSDDPRVDKKKEMEEKRLKQAERVKSEKLEKDIEKSLETIYNNLSEKKWKPAKASINVFLKKFEDASNIQILRSIQSLNSITLLIDEIQLQLSQNLQLQKTNKTFVRDYQKEKETLSNTVKSHEDFEALLKDLLQNHGQDKFPVKKFFEDLRRDRKKIVQERYLLLNKLEEPLTLWRLKKFGESMQAQAKNISLTFSSASGGSLTERPKRQKGENQEKNEDVEVKYSLLSKDVEELLNLVKTIDKGGQWWKFIPKNMKNNATFKLVYSLLEQYRKYEISIQALEANTSLAKDEQKSIENAINFVNNLLIKQKSGFSEEYWEKKLAVYMGKRICDNFIKCLKTLSSRLISTSNLQTEKLKNEVQRLTGVIVNLERNISDLQKKSLFDDSVKKSGDLRSSRRSSKSRQKREQKSKELVESYIQDERNYLNRIDETEKQKQNLSDEIVSLELKSKAIEQQLMKSEERVQQLQKTKQELQKEKYKQFNEISNLKGELEISEGRILEIQSQLQSEVRQYKELYEKVSGRIVEESSKSKELENQNLLLKNNLQQFKTISETTYSHVQDISSQGTPQKKQGPQLNFKLNLETDKVIDFFDTKPQTSRRRPKKVEDHPEPSKTERVQEINLEEKLTELTKEIALYQQKIKLLESENEKLKFTITDLITGNNELKIKIERLLENDKTSQLSKELQQIKTQRQSLINELKKFNQLKVLEIQREVKAAIQKEVNQFNTFLEKEKVERENYYLNVLLPERIKVEIQKFKASQSPVKPAQIDISSEEFLALYHKKHDFECLESKRDFNSQLQIERNKLLEQELPVILGKQKLLWKGEHEKEVEVLLLNLTQEFESRKLQEWVTKQNIITDHWKRILSDKEREWNQTFLDLKLKQSSPSKQNINLTEIQLMDIMKKNENKKVLNILLHENYIHWEESKEVEWKKRESEIKLHWEESKEVEWKKRESEIKLHWEKTVIPQLKTEWEQTKVSENSAIVQKQVSKSDQQIIEEWKQMFLSSIVEYEKDSAINYFIQNELPGILTHQHKLWIQKESQTTKLQQGQLIKQQWALWNKTKQEEIQKQKQDFEETLREIEISYQNQIIEWQEKLFKEQQRSQHFESTLKQQQQKKIQQEKIVIKPEVEIDYKELLNQEKRNNSVLKDNLTTLDVTLKEMNAINTQLLQKQQNLNSKIHDMEVSFSQRLQIQSEKAHRDKQASEKLLQEVKRTIELEWSQKLEHLKEESVRQTKELDQRIVLLKEEWQNAKVIQINNIINIQIKRWEEHKRQEINYILTNQKKIWEQHHREEINLIINSEKTKWIQQRNKQIENIKTTEVSELNQRKELEWENKIMLAKAEWQKTMKEDWKNWLQLQKSSWEQAKTVQINNKIQSAKLSWEVNILKHKQEEWKQNETRLVEDAIKSRIVLIEREYEQTRIPSILGKQYNLWVEQSNRKLEEERQVWLQSLPQLLKSQEYRVYLEQYLKQQSQEYEQTIRSLKTQISNLQVQNTVVQTNYRSYEAKIKLFTSQISEYESRLSIVLKQKQKVEGQLKKFKGEQQTTIKRTVIETHRVDEDLRRSKWAQGEISDLRKIIQGQRNEINSLSHLSREIELLKKDNLGLKESTLASQNSKWVEINEIRQRLQVQIIELSNERNSLLSRITELQTLKYEYLDKDNILSFERQIATLLATIKTKDTEISFLKRSIDNQKNELKEARDQYSDALEQKATIERQISEVKNSKMELQYELKYLKDREEVLKKKLQSKEQEFLSYKTRETFENTTVQTKAKTNQQVLLSYQARFSEIESLLNLKTQESQSKAIQIDRLRYDIQRNEATIHSNNMEIESLRMHLKDIESHFTKLKIEFERNQEELGRIRLSLNQSIFREEDANKQLQIQSRNLKYEQSEKLRLQGETHRLKDQTSKVWRDFNESQKIARMESQRAMNLERQLRELKQGGSRQVDNTEIQMLTKINNEVSELTATNRQLSMKIVLLENQHRIMEFSPEVLKFFLLVQKHTDLLVDYLLKEGIIPSLESYHQFLSQSRQYLASGEVGIYFSKWEMMIRDLFQLCIESRAQDMRVQAEELLRLKQEMNEILEKQIEASEIQSGQIVQDYKSVLVDIKSLVRQYMSSGDREYLSLLCSSLGIEH